MPKTRSRWPLAFLLLTAPLSMRCGGDDSGGPKGNDGEGGEAGIPTSGKGGSSGAGRGGSAGKGSGDAGTGATDMVCTPGETQECVGPGACRGGQACRADGSGFGACDCGEGSGGSAGAGASGGEGGEADVGNAGDSGAPGTGNAGAGGQGGADGGPACDPVLQTGCGAGQKCTSVPSDDPATSIAGCVDDGTVAAGDACTRTEDENVDDCAAGSFCVAPPGGGGTLHCRTFCDSTDDATCDGACGLYEGLFPAGGTSGLCEPRCDLLDPQCESGLMCTFAPDSAPFCSNEIDTPTTLGEPCTFLNECEDGLGCIQESLSSTDTVCGFLCDARAGRGPYCNDAGGPGTEAACIPLASLYETSSQPDAGVCINCATAGFANCSLLLQGGCDEETDCDPLTADLGLEFECDTLGGVCILSP